MKIKLRGRTYELLFTREDISIVEDGTCDYPTTKHKKIRIKPHLEPARELDVVIHECLHACCWDLSEETVTQSATDIAKILWALGWRKHDDRKARRNDRSSQ